MNRFCILIFSLIVNIVSFAQIVQESVRAEADQGCYVVGEHLKLNVQVTLPDDRPSPSRVAYVEIADTAQLHTQAILTLDGGFGYGEIPLPMTMHSGVYQLSIYTRGLRNFGEDTFFTTQIGVINPEKLSPRDNIKFIPANDGNITVMNGLCTSSGNRVSIPNEVPYAYEVEGHIVTAHVDADSEDIETVRLTLVGKSTTIYDGRKAVDGNYDFYTTDIYGEQPVFVSAYSLAGAPLPTTLVSPYAMILPDTLPQLVVSCSEEVLKQRYAEALRQKAIDEWMQKDTQPRTDTFMSTKPVYTYDLDEWTSMNSVGEMLREFISDVQVKRINGKQQLFTNPTIPALVLFDGIPIYDVQSFLDYDAHLLKYVQIYDDRFTFGQSNCYGVVSFISRSGRLPNYKLDEGTTFAAYQFPQHRDK